jgi:glutamine amidotransferase
MGNLQSVSNALSFFKCDTIVSSNETEILNSDGIILPGVGAFGDAIHNIDKLGLRSVINKYSESKKPILGICLGMQILANSSEESPGSMGLGLIAGSIKKIPKLDLVLPHIGWNEIILNNPSNLFNGINNNDCFYFVHSFFFETQQKFISSFVNYGTKITSSVHKANVFGVQFHPERSHTLGIKMLGNFIDIIKKNKNVKKKIDSESRY